LKELRTIDKKIARAQFEFLRKTLPIGAKSTQTILASENMNKLSRI